MSSGTTAERAVRVGRGLLCLPFVLSAGRALIDTGGLREYARRVGLPRPEWVVQSTAGVMLAGALLVVSDAAPKAGGALLGGTLIGITGVVHAFWRCDDALEAQAHRQAFVANAGLLRGILVATARPSAGHRSQHTHPARRGHARSSLLWALSRQRRR